MKLEPKDYVTFIFSLAALVLSLVNLWRSVRDARNLNKRTFEQKRFEALANVAEAKGIIRQWLLAGATLEIEGRKIQDPQILDVAHQHQKVSEEFLKTLSGIEANINEIASAPGAAKHLLNIERCLGMSRTAAAQIEAQDQLMSAEIAAARNKIHAWLARRP